MDVVSSSQTGVEIQSGLFEAVTALLQIEPVFLLGIVLIGISLGLIYRKDNNIPKVKTSILALILYYYLCMMLTHIVGIPTLNECIRLSRLGEMLFNPNVNLIPLSDGISLSFILNIVLFIPLGFLCPLISKTFERMRNTVFIGLGLSLFIETVQLFTLYRATDIDDCFTNVTGTVIGYLCFRLITKLRIVKQNCTHKALKRDDTVFIPVVIIIVAFVLGFFS